MSLSTKGDSMSKRHSTQALHLVKVFLKLLLTPFVLLYVSWESLFYRRFWNRVDSAGMAIVTGDQMAVNWLANASRRAGYQVKLGYEEVEISLRYEWKSSINSKPKHCNLGN